jgi:hypothetical protein
MSLAAVTSCGRCRFCALPDPGAGVRRAVLAGVDRADLARSSSVGISFVLFIFDHGP